MTPKQLELQKKAKLEEAKRLAQMQTGRDVLRNSNVTYGPPRAPEETVTRATRADARAASVRTPQAVDGRLQTADVAAYRAAGQQLSDPNRTTADVQRAVAERVQRGNAIRGATDFPLYQESLNRQAPPPAPPSYADGTLPPNVASMEERYQAQGIEPPSKASPSVRGFLGDMVQANDPRYLTRSAYASQAVPNVVKASIRFGENATGAGARAFRENVAPAATRLNESLGNYAAGGEFAPTGNPAQRLPDNMPPARFPNLRDGARRGTTLLGNTGTPAVSGTAGGGGGGNVSTVYQNPDGSFSDVPQPGATVYNQGRWAGPGQQGAGILDAPNVGGVQTRVADEVNDENARNNILRGGGPGATSAGITYGPRDRTGRRTMTINRANPYAGMSDAAIAPIAEQKRQEIAARRLSGAAQDGNVLRQVQQLQNKAAKTFEQVRGATNNSKAAERAAGVYQDQANQLIEADRNQVYREGDVLRSQTDRYGVDAQTQASREKMMADAAIAQQELFADMSAQQQEALATDVSRVARGKATDTDDPEGVAATYETQLYANLPRNYGQLSRREQGEAMQYATASTDLLQDINKRNPNFQYSSMSELLAGADKALSGGKLNQEEAKFWSSVFREGPWDGFMDYIQGAGVITLPGTDVKATTRRLENFRKQPQNQQDEYFNRVRR